MRTIFYRLPRLTVLVLLVAVAAGLGAALSLGRQEDPTLVERFGFTLVALPGADAERMEALVTEPLEDALGELPEVQRLDSVSRAGVSQVQIELREDLSEAEVDDAWTLIRAQVDQAEAQFPAGTRPTEVERVFVGATTMAVSVIWTGQGEPELALMARLAEQLEDRFQNLDGTEETETYGLPSEEVRVVVDPQALSAAGLTAREAAGRIAAADSKAPAGQLRSGKTNVGVEVGGEFGSISRIRSVPLVQQDNGSAVRVGDVATVTKGLADPVRVLDFHDGRRSITVGAFIQPNQRVDQWAERARRMVADFSGEVAAPVAVEVVFDQSHYTNQRLGGLTRSLGFSALIVFAVLFLVMGWRAALVVGTALPLTVCLVLILFNLFSMPLHQMSVTGLVISLGLLIDNAIVVVDDIDQLRARGAGRLEAIDRALEHLFGPLFASTLTTALAFAPIALLPGSAGEFVGMIGISVIFAVGSSFLISMTVIPSMAGWFDRRRPHEGGRALKRRWWRDGIAIDAITDGYRYTLGAVLHFPALGILIGAIPALAGFYLAGQLPSQFFPQTERNQFQVDIALPADASIMATERAVGQAEAILNSYDGIETTHFTLGEPSPRVYYNMVNATRGVEGIASGWIETESAETTREIISDVQARLRREFPGAQVLAIPFEQGPPSDAPIQFLIAGNDLQTLSRLGDEARRILAGTPGVTYTSASLELGSPTLVLQADEAASALSGQALTGLAAQLNAELEGVRAGSVLEGVEELPVRVIGPDVRRGELADLRAMAFDGGTPLSALGELTLDPQIATITRRDGQRVNDIRAYLEPYTLPAPVFDDFRARLDAAGFELPRGYELLIGGEAENSSDALTDLAATGVPLILVIAGAVALVFNSFRMSLLILTAGFLSVGLAFFGVWLFNLPLGFNAIIGALGLLGIAINGSIVVLSMLRANPRAMQDDIIAQRETVVDATRHIVATTLTTMGGFVPLLLTADAFWMPLAAGISGGVAGSGLLALYFTPAVFRLSTMKPFTRLARILGLVRRPVAEPAE